MAAITVHFDDSGTHDQSPVAVVSALISPVPQWKKFSREWKKTAADEGFEMFHAAEFMANNHKSEFADKTIWNEAKKLRVMRRLRHIICTRTVQGFGITVNKKDYDDLAPQEFRNKFGNFHYTWAVRTVIGLIENWRAKQNMREPFEYIFDRMSQGRHEIDHIFTVAEAHDDALHRYGISKGCHSFRDKSIILPLQASDMVAWLVYQRAMNDVSGKQVNKITAETFDYINDRHFKCGVFKRDHLGELIAKEVEAIRSGTTNTVELSFKGMRYPKPKGV